MTTHLEPEYDYIDFYFGNANYPSGYVWRINKETKQKELLIEYGVGRETLDEIEKIYEESKDEGSSEPHYSTWGEGTAESKIRYGLRWWQKLTPEQEEKEWEFSKKVGMGGGSPATYENENPLYPNTEEK